MPVLPNGLLRQRDVHGGGQQTNRQVAVSHQRTQCLRIILGESELLKPGFLTPSSHAIGQFNALFFVLACHSHEDIVVGVQQLEDGFGYSPGPEQKNSLG